MLRRRFALLIISVFLLLNMSCSSQSNQDIDDQGIGTGDETPTISIYLREYDKFFDDALWTYDDVTIKAKYFGDIEELYNKLSVELLAGEGPDIIKVNYYDFLTVPKLFSSGILTDLNELINEDSNFKLADYNKVILDSGVSDGKRYLIPTSFITPFIYSTSSIMKKNGINIDINNWTWDTMVQIADNFLKQNRSTDKYLFRFDVPVVFFWDLLTASGFKFLDFDSHKSYFNSPEFIELLETFKEKIYPVISPENMNAGVTSKYDLLKDEKVVMLYDYAMISPEYLSIENKNFQSKFNEDMKILPIPSYKGGSGVVAQPMGAIGINAKCKYKKAAFEYIKRLLSKEHHKQEYGVIHRITVNNAALCEEKNYYSQGMEGQVYLPENLLASFNGIMANVNHCNFRAIDIRVIKNEVEDYLNGKKTAEQTAKIIDQKAVIFLNE